MDLHPIQKVETSDMSTPPCKQESTSHMGKTRRRSLGSKFFPEPCKISSKTIGRRDQRCARCITTIDVLAILCVRSTCLWLPCPREPRNCMFISNGHNCVIIAHGHPI